jgi:DnaJ homologue, subfamily C, member 28, conserved domain
VSGLGDAMGPVGRGPRGRDEPMGPEERAPLGRDAPQPSEPLPVEPSPQPPTSGSPPTGRGAARHDLRTWATLVERRIREALDSGEFDELPFRGERLPPEELDERSDEASRMLRRAGAAPPWIETDKRIRALLEERDAVLRRAPRSSPFGRQRDRDAIVRIVREIDVLVLRLEQEAPTPAQHRRRLDLAEELARLDAAAGGRPPGGGGDDRS